MRVLLDTHVFLWWLSDDARLGPRLRAEISNGAHDIYVSSITIAEIAIKRSLGKLSAPPGLLGSLVEEGFEELPFVSSHAAALENLPWHHRDPFDRMLIAQASVDGLALASHDSRISEYDVAVLRD